MTARAHFVALALLALAASCARAERTAPDPCPPAADAGGPVDPALLAFLSRARSAHHVADLEEEQRPERAIAALEAVTRGPFPGGGEQLAPEIREVLADTRARLAELRSRTGAFERAAEEIQKGLELAREPSYFRGHLFEVRGSIEERRAKELEERGETAEAKAAKARALEAYEEAMKIQDAVIDRSLRNNAPR